jgi:hypothetical protein
MALKIPAAVSGDDAVGDDYVVQEGLRAKEAWQLDRGVQGNRTADIRRVTESGGVAYRGIEPTYTAVAGLSGLNVAVYGELRRLERKYGSIFEAGDREMVFYNVELVADDVIVYDGDEWRVVGGTVDYHSPTGRCEVLAKMSVPD